MIRRILDTIAVIAFVAFLPLMAVAQSGVSLISASPGAKPGQGTKTSCSVVGGVWRTSDPAATLDCGAGLTYAAGVLTNTGSSRFGDASLGSTTPPLIARLGTGSTANVFELQNSAGTVLARVLSTGEFRAPIAAAGAADGGYSFDAVPNSGLFANSSVGYTYICSDTPYNCVTNSWAQAAFTAPYNYKIGFRPDDAIHSTADAFFMRDAAATIQLGIDVNGAAVNQTLKAHDGITGTNISGADLTIAAGRGTGTGSGGVLKFQTAPVEASGTTAQTSQTRVTIQKDGGVTFAPILFANLGSPADGTLFFCSDCTIASPCAGAGTGAMAKRLNSTWVCN